MNSFRRTDLPLTMPYRSHLSQEQRHSASVRIARYVGQFNRNPLCECHCKRFSNLRARLTSLLNQKRKQMMLEDLATVAQILEGALLPLSLIYLAREAQLNVKLTKAQFSHTLTDRLYERYLSSTQNEEFVSFLAKDFSSDELTDEDQWRITLWTNAMLVDLFDTFEQRESGLATEEQLDMRLNLLKLGLMRTRGARAAWSLWKPSKDASFVEWFESEFYDGKFDEEAAEITTSLNMRRS